MIRGMANGDEMAERRRWAGDLERVAAIESELDEALRSVRFALTEIPLDKPARVHELLAKAQSAYETTGRLIMQLDDFEEQQRLRSKHQELEARIWEVQRRMRQRDE